MKYLVVLALLLFAAWLIKNKIQQRVRRARGEPPAPQPAVRPITIISTTILVIYGGYLLWYLITQGGPSS